MHESVVRVLIVDDFRDWRQLVRGIISGMPQVEIVGEAEDGLEAVEKAQQLEPRSHSTGHWNPRSERD